MNTENKCDYLFETSWEVCNKVGGIHTVIMTKAPTIEEKLRDKYILIGPDLPRTSLENSEFEEDTTMFGKWKVYAKENGLDFRVGRWKIKSSPIVVLVSYSQYLSQKDEIFAEYWEKWQVDSLTGGWDYIEPFLFGYVAAKVIESYYNFYLSSTDKIVAQFHEWMTGSGLLYLKKNVPQIATSFTTHATVLGRCLAGNNLPLYSELSHYDGDRVANDFNVRAKYSLEKYSALNADVFTTVSDITNKECLQFFKKNTDIVTPNGFEGNFVPEKTKYEQIRQDARKRILDIAQQLSGKKYDDAFLILNSGRYEFKNKGIDIFIKSLRKLKEEKDLSKKPIVAVIAVPAGHNEARVEEYSTHRLENYEYDSVISTLKANNINNNDSENITVIFIPSYLDGKDGVINLNYFDFLTGFDLTIFPSYYEPWGYTPMESMAFGIPSITTTLAGFGLWVKENIETKDNALTVINRDDYNEENCINEMVKAVEYIYNSDEERKEKLKQEALYIFSQVQWKHLYSFYEKAYSTAIEKTLERKNLYVHKLPFSNNVDIQLSWGDKPLWKKFLVKSSLPERLKGLQRLSQNLWWSWNYDAYELFCEIDVKRFMDFERSPVRLLESLTQQDFDRLLNDKAFLEKMDNVVKSFDDYISLREKKDTDIIAYFSMEFGIHDTLKIFSGGLGMLAGDYLKQASDSNKNIVGIGLLYRHGYFVQSVNHEGWQQSVSFAQKFSHLPLLAVRDEYGRWKKIVINFPGRKVYAKIWLCNVGAIKLYLLDTDIEDNNEEDRAITQQLYGGDNEMRLKQEILLGIGGVRALKSLNIEPKLYHSNEGHSAFSSLERLNNYINEENIPYSNAIEIVRGSTLFTTHTPVPAGHDVFSEELLRVYFSQYINGLTLDWDSFMLLGRKTNENRNEKFSMSVLAINCSANINGVSKIHGRVTREMFAYLYNGYFADEINIGYVTNGVHFPTWVAKQWLDLYKKYFDKKMFSDESNAEYWQQIYSVPDKEVWDTHQTLKKELIDFLKQRLEKELRARGETPQLLVKTMNELDENKLTIGFARRFATYKRANLLFTDLKRLEQIVDRGVQFVFAGKAHPKDQAGKDLIKNIINISRMPQFQGKIIFIENYDMFVAKHLIRGVDVWLNTPTRPLEASGTSGEKAIMNGVVNFSVLDGWWAEGWKEGAGWALPEESRYADNSSQNILDAEMIYSTIKKEIIPAYYEKTDDVPLKWVSHIKNTIAKIAPHFTMKRQLDDYFSKYYNQMFERTSLLTENNNAKAIEYALWKKKMKEQWNSIELISLRIPDTENGALSLNEHFKASIVLSTGDINPEYIGVEIVIANKDNDKITKVEKVLPFTLTQINNNQAEYTLDCTGFVAGVHNYAFRIYPKHTLMPSRQDLPLLKWI
ncbi:MAG: alpha-glucan family phosphorylase [Bacteroidales bacterium]|nr:alpha-glucan family phosphorylase [Bacteroidales bacterium]